MIQLGVVHAVAGFDFSYGYKGTGNMDRLKSDSGGLIEVTKVEKVECQWRENQFNLYSRKIVKRECRGVASFLGRPYEVKCDWDGFSFNLNSYYTLPAPGRYWVTLKKDIRLILTEMIVTEDQTGHSLKSMIKIPRFMKGKLSIVWHRRIHEDNVQTFTETNRILSTI